MGGEYIISLQGHDPFVVVNHDLSIGSGRTGVYGADTQYLRSMRLQIEGEDPPLGPAHLREGAIEMHGDLPATDERPPLRVYRRLELSAANAGTVTSMATLTNVGDRTYRGTLTLALETDLWSMFAVRAAVQDNDPDRYRDEYDARREVVLTRPSPRWMMFSVDDVDEVRRVLEVGFNLPAEVSPANPTQSRFMVTLAPGESASLTVHLHMREAEIGKPAWTTFAAPMHSTPLRGVGVVAGDAGAEAVLNQALADVRALSSTRDLEGKPYRFQGAGMPWYKAPFGRDSLISAMQVLAYDASLARDTLRLLARQQGTVVNPATGEEPGKILHEARRDALARSGIVPFERNYQSVDSTPLFLVALGEYVRLTRDVRLFRELRPNVEAALKWMEDYGDHDGDGFLDYSWGERDGLVQKAWKDSPDSIINTNGEVATPPIAVIEAQGYAVWARRQMAACYERAGMPEQAVALEGQADALLGRMLRDFWMEDRQYFALALQGDKDCPARRRQVRIISSNPGHLLWAGILPQPYAAKVAHRLMQDDMFSGWGVRTLSSADTEAYDPLSYHRGSVWSHESGLIGVGMLRYGYFESFDRLFGGLLDLALADPQQQMPELTAGEQRDGNHPPAEYADTCKPQAWAAGAPLYLLAEALDLGRDGAAPRHFPSRLGSFVQVDGLAASQARDHEASVRFDRAPGKPLVTVLKRRDVEAEATF